MNSESSDGKRNNRLWLIAIGSSSSKGKAFELGTRILNSMKLRTRTQARDGTPSLN